MSVWRSVSGDYMPDCASGSKLTTKPTSPPRSQLPLRQLTFLTLAERTAPRDEKPSWSPLAHHQAGIDATADAE